MRRGFTLIELMIVIAIIAIIAAIAIPGLMQSQRASNERSASASLKTITSAEADFRANDRDGNRITDFWTGDVSGLYGLVAPGASECLKLTDVTVAGADFNYIGTDSLGTGPLHVAVPNFMGVSAPKASYWYKALLRDESGAPYATDTAGAVDALGTIGATPNRHHSKFAFMSFPEHYSAGRNCHFVNETNTIFRRSSGSNVRPPGTVPNASALPYGGAGGLVGSNPPEDWPTDDELKAMYSKLD